MCINNTAVEVWDFPEFNPDFDLSLLDFILDGLYVTAVACSKPSEKKRLTIDAWHIRALLHAAPWPRLATVVAGGERPSHLEEAVRKGGRSRMAVLERRALRHAWKRSSVTSLR